MDKAGSSTVTNDSNYEQRLEKIRLTEETDNRFGYCRYTECECRDAWLINIQPSEMLEEQSKVIIAVCDFYFVQQDGQRFKISYPFRPYLYLATLPKYENQLSTHLLKKYSGIITTEVVDKEDLDLKNHLSGLKRTYLKVTFPSVNELQRFKRDVWGRIKKNQEREKNSTSYTALLSRHLGANRSNKEDGEIMETVIDMREHDVPYEMRVCIDEKLFVGKWYQVIGRDSNRKPSIKPHPTLIDPPDPIVLAYDIEVTKLPLKFPDSAIDEIMMISYMIDGRGFLIINRQIVSEDVEDFEYTPRPEYKGYFEIFNMENELSLIRCFFDHIIRVRPSIFVTYNGDSFDWPFVEARAALYELDMQIEIGFSKDTAGEYKSTNAIHMDAYRWVKRDSYLPVGSQNLKACTKAKLRYDPIELDPEQMCIMAREQPQTLANYSVSDAVATYYLYMKYVHPFIFALCTIIPLGPDDVLRKGSGTLCEALLMVEAFHNNIIFPNKYIQHGSKLTNDGHLIESETYVGGHVEAIESGVFRADLPERFRIVPSAILKLQSDVKKTLREALTLEMGVDMEEVKDFDEVCDEVIAQMDDFIKRPMRIEKPKIYHLDVGAMYPNIILTNRLQPSAVVDEEDCMACMYNTPDATCKRAMRWEWRGEIIPASKGEYERIFQQLENEKFGKPPKPFHSLDREQRESIEKKRVQDYCKRAYGKTHITRNEYRYTTICQCENAFYVDTVKAFRDRRYQYKTLLKKAKSALSEVPEDDANAVKSAQGRVVLYESLQLAHKCILNSFYGYVMRKGSRWFSMQMAGIVCHTGANIITEARKLVEQIGKPLELDTDGIWCLIPSSFPENITFTLSSSKKKSVTVSYPGAMLNALIRDNFTNDQYHHLEADGTYKVTSENSIFFEVDGPYLAMILPASKEEGKKLKKRYAVFNFDGSLAELKGFEVKRRGELAMIKYFQTCVFKAFLNGSTHQEAYQSVAKEADYWLDVLFSKGADLTDSELFDLIAENRSMSRKLDDYGTQKSTSISTAKRLAEFLGDDMVKDAGLACRFIISKKPMGSPVTERAIPLAIFQSAPAVAAYYLRKWTHDSEITRDNIDIRKIIDWEYYIERVGSTIQKIVTIPAALQNVSNPVPRIPYPDWLENKRRQRVNDHKQPKINEMFRSISNNANNNIGDSNSNSNCSQLQRDIEDITPRIQRVGDGDQNIQTLEKDSSLSTNGISARKRSREGESEDLNSSIKIRRKGKMKQSRIEKSLGQIEGEMASLVKKTIVDDGLDAWIGYLKSKWRLRRDYRKRSKTSNVSSSLSTRTLNPLEAMVETNRRNVQESHWQIIQLGTSPTDGILSMWVIVNGRMLRMQLCVPRVVYVNDRELNSDGKGVLVKKTLPRMKPVYNLYRYAFDESKFQSNLNALNRELCAMRVEGIYEAQVPIEFRAILELGSCCKLKSDRSSTLALTNVNLEQLEAVTDAEYLPEKSIRSAYYYEYRQDKFCVIAVVNTAANDAVIVGVNMEFPNVTKIYDNEKAALEGTAVTPLLERKPTVNFSTFQCSTMKEAQNIVDKYLRGIRQFDTQPMFIAVHSNEPTSVLMKGVQALRDFPLVRIHCPEPTNLFSALDWQRSVPRRIIKHYFNSFVYLHDYVQYSRYLLIPLGNVPADISLFAADLFYARHLTKFGHVLWISPLIRPDLGGKELDDWRIGSDWSYSAVTDRPPAIVNHSRLCTEVCVELELGAVTVNALVHNTRIADAEGGSGSTGFLSSVSLSGDVLCGKVKTIAQYDEAASVSGAMKVLRSMVQECAKDIHLSSNAIADQLIVNIYRWIHSPRALLYEPAIARAVDILVTKLCLLLVAEITRMGGEVLHASQTRMIICTKRANKQLAKAFITSMISTLKQNPLFAALYISPVHFWNILLWMDIENYVSIEFADVGDEVNDKEDCVTSKLSIADLLPEEAACKSTFSRTVLDYLLTIATKMKSEVSDEELVAYREDLIRNEFSERLFAIFSKLAIYKKDITMPDRTASREKLQDAPLQLAKCIIHFLSFDRKVAQPVEKLRSQLLRLLGYDDSCEEGMWHPMAVCCNLAQVFCDACNQYNDLNAVQDDEWICKNCKKALSVKMVEGLLIERLKQLAVAYSLQDFRCTKCGSIRKNNLMRFCECSGHFEGLITESELTFNLEIFERIAWRRQLKELAEVCRWFLQPFGLC